MGRRGGFPGGRAGEKGIEGARSPFAKLRAEAAWREERGYERGSVAHFMNVHPEAWERATSKNGNPIVKVSFDGKSYGFPENRTGSIRPSWWSEEAEAVR